MMGLGALASLASSVVANGQVMREDGTSMILKIKAGEKVFIAGRFEKNKIEAIQKMS